MRPAANRPKAEESKKVIVVKEAPKANAAPRLPGLPAMPERSVPTPPPPKATATPKEQQQLMTPHNEKDKMMRELEEEMKTLTEQMNKVRATLKRMGGDITEDDERASKRINAVLNFDDADMQSPDSSGGAGSTNVQSMGTGTGGAD